MHATLTRRAPFGAGDLSTADYTQAAWASCACRDLAMRTAIEPEVETRGELGAE